MTSTAFSPVLLLIISLFLGSQATSPSPQASTELICHTNHASECYPRAFQPRPYFQKVHDDQELPPGLHVRMNLETGQKEAKLNDPNENDESIYDVAVVPSDDFSDAASETPSRENTLPPGYAQAVLQAQQEGSIRPPPNGDDGSSFGFNLGILNTASPDTDSDILVPALDVLSDLAHDIYYGLQLSKDRSSIHKLVSLLGLNNTNSQTKASAALVFGAAIQNNPAALSAALSHCYNDELPAGPMEAVIMALIHEQAPTILSRFIYLLSALSQDPAQLLKFMNADGMDLLFNVYDADGASHDARDKLRVKVANFILDHFLQDEAALQSFDENRPENKQSTEEEDGMDDKESWVVVPEGVVPKDGPKKGVERLEDWRVVFERSIETLRRNKDDQERLSHAQDLQDVLEVMDLKIPRTGRKTASKRSSSLEL